MDPAAVVCQSCGLTLPSLGFQAHGGLAASAECQATYDELSLYTLTLGDAYFIHQHIVDAYAAQHAGLETKPIAIFFALAGLYLSLEKGFAGREVQRAHMAMAKSAKQWPNLSLPSHRGRRTVADPLTVDPGSARDAEIKLWCQDVWDAWSHEHATVAAATDALLKP